MSATTHDGLEVGSFTIQPSGHLKCSKGHVGAMRVFDLRRKTDQPPEFKCQTCNEIGLAFDHGDRPLVKVPYTG